MYVVPLTVIEPPLLPTPVLVVHVFHAANALVEASSYVDVENLSPDVE